MKEMCKSMMIWIIRIVSGAMITFLGTWLIMQYQQPQIVCYTDETYQKINGFLVGTIFLVNEGRSPETNVSISIGEKLSASDIDIAYLSVKPVITNQVNDTQITIPRLKPGETAEIVFRFRGINDNFKIKDVTSDSGNIRYEDWIKSWWEFSRFQLGIILLVVIIALSGGFVIGSRIRGNYRGTIKP